MLVCTHTKTVYVMLHVIVTFSQELRPSSIYDACQLVVVKTLCIKPQPTWIVRFMDRTTIGCDWANVRPIGKFFYDLQHRSNTAKYISTRGRAITNDWRISMARAIAGNRATSGSDQRLMYEISRRPATDRTINRSLHPALDRSSNRGIL